jgi:hypothetical protein
MDTTLCGMTILFSNKLTRDHVDIATSEDAKSTHAVFVFRISGQVRTRTNNRSAAASEAALDC